MELQRSIATVLRERLDDNKYTDDILSLHKHYAYVPLFVYGRQQRNFSNHDILRGMSRVGVGTTLYPQYNMMMCDGEPVAFRSSSGNSSSGRVYGEVYVVPPVVIADMDRQHCRGYHFLRGWDQIVFWSLEAGPGKLYHADAFIYLGNTPVWQEAIDSGKASLKRPLKDDKGFLYRYLKPEDDRQLIF